jgi:hypothetical protein
MPGFSLYSLKLLLPENYMYLFQITLRICPDESLCSGARGRDSDLSEAQGSETGTIIGTA